MPSDLNNFKPTPGIKVAAVIGDPISHSLSPALHNHLLQKHGIKGLYIPLKITPENLESSLQNLIKMGFSGFNVTMPHKERVLQLCDHLSKTALATKAVNTVVITENQKLYGHNSDGEGFINNLKNNYPDFIFTKKQAVILGAGGASRAICFALMKEGVGKVIIVNRNLDRAQNLADDLLKISGFENFEIEINDWNSRDKNLENCDLLINTTSLGMAGKDELEIDLKSLKKSALVTDIIYKPLMTKFLLQAQKQGNPIVTGIGMLIYQGLVGFELWFGKKPEIDAELIKKITDLSLTN